MKESNKIYFGDETEKAMVAYVMSSGHAEREQIFLAQLKIPIEKLIENIIFTYNFGALESDWTCLQQEVLSHLYVNLDKFDPERGKKSYSYLGTMAKNYLIQRSIRQSAEIANISIDDPSKSGWEEDVFLENDFFNYKEMNEFIETLVEELEKEYEKVDHRSEQKRALEAVIYFLTNRHKEDVYNKKYLYLLLKERTNLSTRQLTKCLKQLKVIYARVKRRYYG